MYLFDKKLIRAHVVLFYYVPNQNKVFSPGNRDINSFGGKNTTHIDEQSLMKVTLKGRICVLNPVELYSERKIYEKWTFVSRKSGISTQKVNALV